ncbi:hypothetical protein [Bradyrhizobium sp. RT9a]|uniref:hypothetical protein n=1 Tax=Bradyrhizobium sp. RT9a TaxID=3156384 RepID=UPI003391CC36
MLRLDALDEIVGRIRELNEWRQRPRGWRAIRGMVEGLAERPRQNAVVLLLLLQNDLFGDRPELVVPAVTRQQLFHQLAASH